MMLLEQMEVAVAPDCQAVTVQAMQVVSDGGVVFYASAPSNCATSTAGATSGMEVHHRLVTVLWEYLLAKEIFFGKRFHFSNGIAHPIQIIPDPLGRPNLLLGEHRGPSISFTTAGDKVWAAIACDDSDIGIDVAGSAEFPEGYPTQRVFHAPELRQALELADGNPASAAALLWSVKEAVVKALGCAFHLVDPRDVHVHPSAVTNGGPLFLVRLSGKALVRFPMANQRPITVRSLSLVGMWLSIAALNWHHDRVHFSGPVQELVLGHG